MWFVLFYLVRLLIINQVEAQELVVEPRIVGGNGVAVGQRPFQVSLQAPVHFCGGSILNSRYVITAAHCMVGMKASNIKIYLGTVSLKNPYRVTGASKIIIHENYDADNSNRNDIALILVTKRITYDDYVKPVRLPKSRAPVNPGTKAVVSGWGNLISPTSGTPNYLREVTVTVIDRAECRRLLKPKGFNIYDTQICTKDSGKRKGQCNGDSGGPLTVNGNTLIGIVSFSLKDPDCASPNYPAVQTQVSDYIGWINSHTP